MEERQVHLIPEPGSHVHDLEDFKKRFIISTIVTIPILFLSPVIQSFLGFRFDFPGSVYVTLVLASIVYFYGGYPFLKGIFRELRAHTPGMMTLIAVAISVAYFYSAAVVFGLQGEGFFWELATLIDIMLLGHWIEMKSVLGASRALEELVKIMPQEAHLLKDHETITVKVEDLRPGDRVLVKPGEKVPVDGVVVEGSSSMNESLLTGESKPVSKHPGDKVIGGAINGEGSVVAEVNKTGKETYLNQVITLVRQAQESKSRAQDLANRAALYLVIIALGRRCHNLCRVARARTGSRVCHRTGRNRDGHRLPSCAWTCCTARHCGIHLTCGQVRSAHPGTAGIRTGEGYPGNSL